MIQVFYSSNGQAEVAETTTILKEINVRNALWLDLFNPTGDEKRAVEEFLGTNLQSRAQAEEIESSSRYSETLDSIFINTDFLTPSADSYNMESVSFILTGNVITSIRQVPLRSFTDIQRRLLFNRKLYPTGFHILIGILENRIDLDADMIELMSKETAQYSRRVGLGEDVNEEFLLDINQLQENTMLVRENIVDKQRMLSSMLKSEKTPKSAHGKLNILLKDVSSLINHTNFSFERLEYLQNTVLGIINLDQNKIMKVFTFVSLLLMPPTLIASFYGMNIKLPLAGGNWDILIVSGLMLAVIIGALIIFKVRKML
ncbi:MAG: magnesium and cobalt transport protein CorA [Bacteroidales bacterium]|nr:magnesium and cobalt transport protein CorA [Candidatus Cacconaster caballi]